MVGYRGKKPTRVGSLSSLTDLLPAFSRDIGLERKVNEMALLALWISQVTIVAGPEAAEQSRATRLKKQGNQVLLQVKVSNAALASELGFHLPAIREGLNRFSPQTGLMVDRIQLSVGILKQAEC